MVNFGVKTILLLSILIHTGSAEYDECPEIEGPTVWIDNAPDCQANSTYCHQFGLDYLCSSNITDEGDSCFGGTQVKCSYPSVPLATPLPATTLKLITYNVWELTFLVTQIGQRERTCRIPAKIFEMHPDADVVVFEEVFMGGCILNVNNSLALRDILGGLGFVHYTRTVGDSLAILPGVSAAAKRNSTVENGGVFIASRWPILQEEQMVFENYDPTTSDALSAKGVMYAQVRKTVDGTSKDFHIFGTHMQATEKPDSPGVRVLQAGEILDFMQSFSIPVSEPVLYAGDLNGDLINKEENARAIIAALNATMPRLVGPINITYDHLNNDNLDPTDKEAEYLDYILTGNGREQPIKASIQVLRPRSDQPFEVCRSWRPLYTFPHSPDCRDTKTVSDLSDHYPVVGVFEYPDKTGMTTLPPGVHTTSGSSSPDKTGMTTLPPGVHTTSGSSSPALHASVAVVASFAMMINSNFFKYY